MAIIPLRKDFYLKQLPSPPLVLKLPEDDPTTVKLAPGGTVEYWRCIFWSTSGQDNTETVPVMTSTVSRQIPSTYYNWNGTGESCMSTILTKEQAARQIWLLYFNRTLLERGVITEKQHNQMKVKILSQPGSGWAPNLWQKAPSVQYRTQAALYYCSALFAVSRPLKPEITVGIVPI